LIGEQGLVPAVRRLSLFMKAGDEKGVDRNLGRPAVELLDVDPVGFVILHLHAERVGLDPEIDVLADEPRRKSAGGFLDFKRNGEDVVVARVSLEFAGYASEGGFGVAFDDDRTPAVEFDAFGKRTLLPKTVEVAGGLPGVAPGFAYILFKTVDVFDNGDGNDDIVLHEF
jgi:hypothetical protein